MLLQIDSTIIQSASEVRPDNGMAYGWLIAVLLIVILGLSTAVVLLFRRVSELQDSKENHLEKYYQIASNQTQGLGAVKDGITQVASKQDVHTEQLRTIITQTSKGGGNG
jgi:Tfp pilus assembly protein PilO